LLLISSPMYRNNAAPTIITNTQAIIYNIIIYFSSLRR
jgi:hypothetical protein